MITAARIFGMHILSTSRYQMTCGLIIRLFWLGYFDWKMGEESRKLYFLGVIRSWSYVGIQISLITLWNTIVARGIIFVLLNELHTWSNYNARTFLHVQAHLTLPFAAVPKWSTRAQTKWSIIRLFFHCFTTPLSIIRTTQRNKLHSIVSVYQLLKLYRDIIIIIIIKQNFHYLRVSWF